MDSFTFPWIQNELTTVPEAEVENLWFCAVHVCWTMTHYAAKDEIHEGRRIHMYYPTNLPDFIVFLRAITTNTVNFWT